MAAADEIIGELQRRHDIRDLLGGHVEILERIPGVEPGVNAGFIGHGFAP